MRVRIDHYYFIDFNLLIIFCIENRTSLRNKNLETVSYAVPKIASVFSSEIALALRLWQYQFNIGEYKQFLTWSYLKNDHEKRKQSR